MGEITLRAAWRLQTENTSLKSGTPCKAFVMKYSNWTSNLATASSIRWSFVCKECSLHLVLSRHNRQGPGVRFLLGFDRESVSDSSLFLPIPQQSPHQSPPAGEVSHGAPAHWPGHVQHGLHDVVASHGTALVEHSLVLLPESTASTHSDCQLSTITIHPQPWELAHPHP